MMNVYRHQRALYCKLMWKQNTSINQDAEELSDDISPSQPVHTGHRTLTHPHTSTPHSYYINKYIWNPRRWRDVCLWSWNDEGCTVRVLSGGGGIIYITVTSTATEDSAPLCWALCTNTAKSHLGRIHLTRHRYPQQGCWANHRQLLSQPAERNRHFPSTTFQTYFRHLV